MGTGELRGGDLHSEFLCHTRRPTGMRKMDVVAKMSGAYKN
jgi:hypothetical protein